MSLNLEYRQRLSMTNEFEILKKTARERRTEKVIAGTDAGIFYSPVELARWNSIVFEAVAAAGMAPFHFDRGIDGVPEPWRVRFSEMETCRKLAKKLGNWMEIKASNKIPGMLAACGCMLLVTWLPQFRGADPVDQSIPREKRIEIDDEHLAATAAMVQSLLLILTAAGLGTYWSSGGVLGSQEVFNRLGIGSHERLMAAVFVEYPNGEGHVLERIPGKNRPLRTQSNRWFSEVMLNL